MLRKNIPEIMVIINESTKRLENELSISHDEMLRINDAITKRINITLSNHQETETSESTGNDSNDHPQD